MDWMYNDGGQIQKEDYLLGKKVDSKLISNADNDSILPPQIQFKTSDNNFSQVDMTKKIREDPLVNIKKRVLESTQKFRENPMSIKKQQNIKPEKQTIEDHQLDIILVSRLKSYEKAGLDLAKILSITKHKREKKEHKTKKDETSSDNNLKSNLEKSDNQQQLHKQKFEQRGRRQNDKKSFEYRDHRRNKNRNERHRSVQYRRSNSSDREHKSKHLKESKNRHGYYKNKNNRRSRSLESQQKIKKDKHRDKSSSASSSDDERRKRNTLKGQLSPENKNYGLFIPIGYSVKKEFSSPPPVKIKKEANDIQPKSLPSVKKKKLTDEEMDKLRNEMITDAKIRDKERSSNVKRYRKHDKKEEEEQKPYNQAFLIKQMAHAVSHVSVERSIKTNGNKLRKYNGIVD